MTAAFLIITFCCFLEFSFVASIEQNNSTTSALSNVEQSKNVTHIRAKRQWGGFGGGCCMTPIMCCQMPFPIPPPMPPPFPVPIPQPVPVPQPVPMPMPMPMPVPVPVPISNCCSCCMPMCGTICMRSGCGGGYGGYGGGYGGGYSSGGCYGNSCGCGGFGGGYGRRKRSIIVQKKNQLIMKKRKPIDMVVRS